MSYDVSSSPSGMWQVHRLRKSIAAEIKAPSSAFGDKQNLKEKWGNGRVELEDELAGRDLGRTRVKGSHEVRRKRTQET